MRRAIVWSIGTAALLVLIAVLAWPRGRMASRDIGCAQAAAGRGQEICRALSASMEWTWMGHAIVSPGWRVTWKALAHVWCAEQVTDADLPALEALSRASSDWRLAGGADDLIRIAKNRGGNGGEPENSIFNPKNPSYILKDGCPERQASRRRIIRSMHFPRYWSEGRAGGFKSWRWSDTSAEEARIAAQEAADRIAAQFAQDGWPGDRYGYPDRPLREPVLREFKNPSGEVEAAITRNSYGCRVLNTARMMFVDVDLPAAGSSGGILGSLFGRRAPADPAQPFLARAEAWAQQNPGWNWRIYRTFSGLRLIATHAFFDPAHPVCQTVFDATGADPLYRRLCQQQQSFRARLTAKPWRCGLPNPPGRWPFSDPFTEQAYADWVGTYESVAKTRASCTLLSAGNQNVDPALQPLIAVHDEMTQATSGLPLA
jgi:hypothetical protein